MVYIGTMNFMKKKTGLDLSELVPWTIKIQSYVVRFGSLNIWVGPGLVAVHGCPFWGQKTGLNWTCKH